MTATRQPNWEFVANLGDHTPLYYGGYFIYRDTTGVYAEEGEYVFVDGDEKPTWRIHRFILDKLKLVTTDTHMYLVPNRYDPSWPYPVEQYDEWFHQDLDVVAAFSGTNVEELRKMFCSDDAKERAWAYHTIGEFHGFDNLDAYPLVYTNEDEVRARYTRGELNG
jgi:hypothetical protein